MVQNQRFSHSTKQTQHYSQRQGSAVVEDKIGEKQGKQHLKQEPSGHQGKETCKTLGFRERACNEKMLTVEREDLLQLQQNTVQ